MGNEKKGKPSLAARWEVHPFHPPVHTLVAPGTNDADVHLKISSAQLTNKGLSSQLLYYIRLQWQHIFRLFLSVAQSDSPVPSARDFRVIMLHHFRRGFRLVESLQELKEVYGDNAPS